MDKRFINRIKKTFKNNLLNKKINSFNNAVKNICMLQSKKYKSYLIQFEEIWPKECCTQGNEVFSYAKTNYQL